MMYSVSSNKFKIDTSEPTTSEKLAQIRSGKQLKRAKSGLQKKSVVVHGNDGSKIVKNQTEEKFEESGVTRKKRNYIMYESKLSTEKNTEIKEFKKKKKPVRRPSPRVEEKIVVTKKRKDYLDNYQYHESKVLRDPNPKYQGVVRHQRLGDIVGGFEEKTIKEITRYSTGTYLPKEEPATTYSTKTTIIKTPYKSIQTTYKPLRTPYQPVHTPYKPLRTTNTTTTTTQKRIQTPYVPLHKPYIPPITTPIVTPYVPPVLPSYQTIQTTSSYVSSSKPSYESVVVSPYKPLHKPMRPVKTPYNGLRQHKTEVFRVKTNSRSGAKTPAVKVTPSIGVNRTINNNYDYSSKTFHIKKPNVITRKTDNVLSRIKSNRGKTPQTYSTNKEVRTISSYRTRETPVPQNLYQNNYQTSTNRTTTITKIVSGNVSGFEPKSILDDDYGTKTINAVSRLSKRIEDDFDGDNVGSKYYEKSYNVSGPNSNSQYKIKVERRTEIFDDGSYGKGPSIRNKYKRKK